MSFRQFNSRLFAISVVAFAPSLAISQRPAQWKMLHCRGVKRVTIGLGSEQPKVEDSSDVFDIIDHGKALSIEVNGPEFKKHLGSVAPAPDTYVITNFNEHGLAAIHKGPTDAVIHTVTLSADGSNGLWSESGVS